MIIIRFLLQKRLSKTFEIILNYTLSNPLITANHFLQLTGKLIVEKITEIYVKLMVARHYLNDVQKR